MSEIDYHVPPTFLHGAEAHRFADDITSGYTPRATHASLLFAIPTLLAGLSWASNGQPFMTDSAFICLTVICAVLCIGELVYFSRRFGIGGIVLYGGVIIWFSLDYFTVWYGRSFGGNFSVLPAVVIAKAAFYHCLFIMCASFGLNLRPWRRALAWARRIPEPSTANFYLVAIAICFVVGFSPYFIFTREGGIEALTKSMTGGRAYGASWTVGRSGSVNTNWGAYVAQLLQVGQVGSQIAVFFAILIARNTIQKLLCWTYWLIHVALAFGSGTRGIVAFMALPVLGLLFLKYHALAADMFKRVSVRAYVIGGVVGIGILMIIQLQILYRNSGFDGVQLGDLSLTKLEGNSMFSEGLQGWAIVPGERGFFANRFPGEGIIRPMPDTLLRFLIGPIPALWNDKPIDQMWAWYNHVITGRSETEYEGTTVSTGLVGDWYFRYGTFGVIEGGLFFGWLALMVERVLQNAAGCPMQLLLAFGVGVFLFKTFRNFTFIDLYPQLIGLTFLAVVIWIYNAVSGAKGGRLGAGRMNHLFLNDDTFILATDDSIGWEYPARGGLRHP